jgi:transposase
MHLTAPSHWSRSIGTGGRDASESVVTIVGMRSFVGVQPRDTGRPGYHPRMMLKLYIYGYLNRVPSSRRLERECQRNIEMIWLTGQLAPDFKTIADFRKDNGKAIREVCREFVALCRKLGLLSAASVAIDGSKFKAVNARDKNFTEAKMKRRLERIDESIARYLSQLETADRHGDAVPEAKTTRLKSKIEKLKEEIVRLNAINAEMMKSEDKQVSLTDPDARSMATSGKDTGIVGYNVQIAVDTQHHLIVAHEVTNVGTDRHQLLNMAEQARTEMGVETLDAVADRGYYEGEEIKACEESGITVTLPKPQTSGAKAAGRFGKQDFVYVAADDVYRCPAGGLIVPASALAGAHRQLIVTTVARNRLPTVYPGRGYVAIGGLVSHGVVDTEQYWLASRLRRILKGEKPADLPVQEPTKFELVLNLKTAKSLGLEVPPQLLARADEVIE